MGLRPVSYRYRSGSTALQYGLIAEQVARRLPALVQRGADGRPAGVYYQELPVLLLGQVQRQQRHIPELHRRADSGVFSLRRGYHSFNCGKLCLAPMHAQRLSHLVNEHAQLERGGKGLRARLRARALTTT